MARARALFPGGVSSPVRAFGGVGGEPFVVERGEGARIWDVDGNEYIDYVLSWGPLVLGQRRAAVLDALRETMARGTSFGIPTGLEVELAELVRAADAARRDAALRLERHRGDDERAARRARRHRVATCSSSSTAAITATRDSFLVRAGSGVATLGLPNSPGVPDALAALTLTAPFNDVDARRGAHARATRDRVAAIIVEPVVGNAGFIPPDPAFLPALRPLADEHGALLIFDEVMTGFRIAPGGAASASASTPDLTTLGKVIGGGLPVAAYGGRRDLMEQVAPQRTGVPGGHALRAIRSRWRRASRRSRALTPRGARRRSRSARARSSRGCAASPRGAACRSPPTPPARCSASSSAPSRCAPSPTRSTADVALFRRFFHAALARGVYLAPSPFEAGFISAAHGDAEIALDARAAGRRARRGAWRSTGARAHAAWRACVAMACDRLDACSRVRARRCRVRRVAERRPAPERRAQLRAMRRSAPVA